MKVMVFSNLIISAWELSLFCSKMVVNKSLKSKINLRLKINFLWIQDPIENMKLGIDNENRWFKGWMLLKSRFCLKSYFFLLKIYIWQKF